MRKDFEAHDFNKGVKNEILLSIIWRKEAFNDFGESRNMSNIIEFSCFPPL